MATVIEIVKAHLVDNGFDGLVNPDIECGCLQDDLAPCGNIGHDCEPGYRGADETGEGDWSMYRTKERARESLKVKKARREEIAGQDGEIDGADSRTQSQE